MSTFFRNSFYIVYTVITLLYLAIFFTPYIKVSDLAEVSTGTFVFVIGAYILHRLSDRDHPGVIRRTAMLTFGVASFPAALGTLVFTFYLTS